MIIFYNFFLSFYKASIKVASLWNDKASQWVNGRKNVWRSIEKTWIPDGRKVLWMHCASHGEFEQGRPLLKLIKQNNPAIRIVISFFSPSGYSILKNNDEWKEIFYLPMDSPSHAQKWLDTFQPSLVLWVKYEYWYYYLKEINQRRIPLILFSAVYRQNQIFFKKYGGLHRQMLRFFSHIFVQNKTSYHLLHKLTGDQKVSMAGDTRCDRVINIAKNFTEVEGIAGFCDGHQVVVAGSTWEEDEVAWNHFVKTHPAIKFIIAPHETDKENLSDVRNRFPGCVFYSDWIKKEAADHQSAKETNCLIIDHIGSLSRLYYYATVAYVGGGFGANGLHNILEPAVYGKPIIIGPEYSKNFEAVELMDRTALISIESAVGLEKVMETLLSNESALLKRGDEAKKYVYENKGASEKIYQYLVKEKLLEF